MTVEKLAKAFEDAYIIYKYAANDHVMIHRTDCSQLFKMGGKSQYFPPNSWYIGPFDTVVHAEWYVREHHGGRGYGCRHCNPTKDG